MVEAARQPICKGFAIGRSIFKPAAEAWLKGDIDATALVEQVSASYRKVIEHWNRARADAAG